MTENQNIQTSAPIDIEGYSYRTSSRFGSRVWLTISPDQVTITGPRLGKIMYRYWIGVQILFLLATVASIFLALILLDWHWLLAAVLSLGLHGCAGGFGAGCLWEMADLINFGKGSRGETVTFPRAQINGVSIGKGWARRWMWLMLLPYYYLMDKTTADNVSFLGPDGTDAQGVYAIHMRNHDEAVRLAELLKAEIH